jgi:hypothetical protein
MNPPSRLRNTKKRFVLAQRSQTLSKLLLGTDTERGTETDRETRELGTEVVLSSKISVYLLLGLLSLFATVPVLAMVLVMPLPCLL